MAGVATMPSSAALPFCESCKQEVEAETNESNGFTCVPTRVPPSCLPDLRVPKRVETRGHRDASRSVAASTPSSPFA